MELLRSNLANSTVQPPRPIPPWYRWELMVLLWLTFSLHQIDRVIFAVQYDNIRDELGLTDFQMGLCAWLLFVVMAALVPLAGYVGDRYSKKWIITIALIFWSSATVLTGMAKGIASLVMWRSFATGGGEAFYGPASTAMIASFHKKTRAIALSIHQSAVYFGPMIAAYVGVIIGNAFGWRAVFFFFGGLGVLLGLLLMYRLREAPIAGDSDTGIDEQMFDTTPTREKISLWEAVKPILRFPVILCLAVGLIVAFLYAKHITFIGEEFGWYSILYVLGALGVFIGIFVMYRLRTGKAQVATSTDISEGSRDLMAEEQVREEQRVQEKIPFWTAVRQIVRIPTVLLLVVGFTAIVFVNNAYLTIAPTYIYDRFDDVTRFQASFYGMSMHFIAAFIGVMGGAFLSDTLVRRWSRFRILLQTTVMFLGAPMVFLIGYVDSVAALWVVLFMFGLFRGLYEANTYAAIYDVVPPKLRAMVVGLALLVAMSVGAFGPLFFGYMGTLYEAAELARSDGFAMAFRYTSLVWVLGGFCVLMTVLFTFKKDRLKD